MGRLNKDSCLPRNSLVHLRTVSCRSSLRGVKHARATLMPQGTALLIDPGFNVQVVLIRKSGIQLYFKIHFFLLPQNSKQDTKGGMFHSFHLPELYQIP